MIRLIISGSRSITDDDYVCRVLDKVILANKQVIEYVLIGMCPEGVDAIAYSYCKKYDIIVKKFPAKWNDLTAIPCKVKTRNSKQYNTLAGFNRNEEMCQKGTYLLAINDYRCGKQGTPGTNDMISRAHKKVGMSVTEIKYGEHK